MSPPPPVRGPHRSVFAAALANLALPLLLALPAARAAGPAPRVVSIGDLHGDFRHAMAVLRAAGLAEEEGDAGRKGPDGRPFAHFRGVRWLGGNATLVQTGDIVDRGAFARDLYALFEELRRQAPAAGGRVVNLIGNHELMNVNGDLRYVSKEDTAEFGGEAARREAFRANTGWVGRQILEEFQAAFVAGETLFVHAGLLPEHLQGGVEELNNNFREQLRASVSNRHRSKPGALLQGTGPVWLRRLATGKEQVACSKLAEALALAGAKRMVVGHTQVEEGSVRPRCGGRLLMADTIISKEGYPECWSPGSMKAHGCQGSLSYVELRGNEAVAVRAPEEATIPITSSKNLREL